LISITLSISLSNVDAVDKAVMGIKYKVKEQLQPKRRIDTSIETGLVRIRGGGGGGGCRRSRRGWVCLRFKMSRGHFRAACRSKLTDACAICENFGTGALILDDVEARSIE
jgi:hypothetical protein